MEEHEILHQILAEVKGLKTDVGDLKADVGSLKTDVGSLKADMADVKADISSLKTDVSGLKADMTEVKTDVSGLKTDVSSLKTDVSGLKADMADVKGQLAENTGFIKALLHQTEELDAKFDGLLSTTATKEAVQQIEGKMATKKSLSTLVDDVHYLVRKIIDHDDAIRELQKAVQ
jgi:chromosome segregation ATPase